MANQLFGGFHPVDSQRARVRRYEVASSYGTALFKGDCVVLVTAGVIQAAAAGAGNAIVGVIRDVSYVDAYGKRVFNTYLPATTVYSPTTRGSRTASWVYVYDDPDTEFWACNASNANTNTEALVWAAIGARMNLTASAGSTTYRVSGHTLDGNPTTGATNQFDVLEVVRKPARDLASANFAIRTRINTHQNAAATAGI